MAIDLNSLTLGETATIEERGGYALTSLLDESAPKGNMLAALAMVFARRAGRPDFSWNDATALTIPEAYEILGIETPTLEAAPAEAPEEAAPKAPSARSAKEAAATATP